jgi:hypothetical protein
MPARVQGRLPGSQADRSPEDEAGPGLRLSRGVVPAPLNFAPRNFAGQGGPGERDACGRSGSQALAGCPLWDLAPASLPGSDYARGAGAPVQECLSFGTLVVVFGRVMRRRASLGHPKIGPIGSRDQHPPARSVTLLRKGEKGEGGKQTW